MLVTSDIDNIGDLDVGGETKEEVGSEGIEVEGGDDDAIGTRDGMVKARWEGVEEQQRKLL